VHDGSITKIEKKIAHRFISIPCTESLPSSPTLKSFGILKASESQIYCSSSLRRKKPVESSKVSSGMAREIPFACLSQGTRLGSILFAVMVYDLLRSWGPRVKFVDDLTELEIVPRNSSPAMRYIANDIHSFAIDNDVRLNSKKCKLLPVTFVHFDSSVWPSLFLARAYIDSVGSFKFLGIYIASDSSWTKHCDVIVEKVNGRRYAIRKLKGARFKENDLVAVYCSLIRSIYGSVAFTYLPNYLSNTLEGIQKRALSLIYPKSSYDVALKRSNLTTFLSCILIYFSSIVNRVEQLLI